MEQLMFNWEHEEEFQSPNNTEDIATLQELLEQSRDEFITAALVDFYGE